MFIFSHVLTNVQPSFHFFCVLNVEGFGLRLKILDLVCANSWETGLVVSDFCTAEGYLL